MVEHLIEDGHRRIAAIVGKTSITTGRERYEGYISALHRHNIPHEKELIFFGLPKEEFGYLSAKRLLELSRPPSAILAGNNLLTVGCLRAINEKCLRIPGDISIAAFDDLDWSTLLNPALTVIRQPTYHLGRCACDLILKRIADPHRELQEIILETELHIRQSCADHPAEKKVC
jgi:DNA-binding LacI/PurR family transcriptional regulator